MLCTPAALDRAAHGAGLEIIMKLYGLMTEQRLLVGVIALLTAVQAVAHALMPAARWLPMLRYCVMLLCALLVLTSYWNTHQAADWSLLMLAMLLTLAADTFLILSNRLLIGLLFFICVQLTYIRRYAKWLFGGCAAAVLAVAAAVAAAILLLDMELPLLPIAAVGYACLLALAVVTSFGAALPLPNRRLAQAGMLLFALCDIHLALHHLLPAGFAYRAIAFQLVWIFYLPAQCLLALSATAFHPVPARLQ